MSAMGDLKLSLLEHGVSYGEYGDGYIHWTHNGASYTAQRNIAGKLIVCNLTPEQAIEATLGPQITGETSDGYHTFNELYHHRAVLFSVIVRDHPESAWKAKRHHDGTMYDGMFIVGIDTPEGQATYHYDIDPYWDMFECRELDAAPEWDGHTPDDAIARIATLGRGKTDETRRYVPERTCTPHGEWKPITQTQEVRRMYCDCGHELGMDERGSMPFNYTHLFSMPRFCPECGRKLVSRGKVVDE